MSCVKVLVKCFSLLVTFCPWIVFDAAMSQTEDTDREGDNLLVRQTNND